jgi:hypothetical protein
MKTLALALGLGMAAATAQAQSLVLGAGYSYFSDASAQDAATLSLEYQFAPFYTGRVIEISTLIAADHDSEGDSYVGVGLGAKWRLDNDWFIEASTMPGYYNDGTSANDLGGHFHFRSLFGVGRTMPSGNAVSVALTHKSNASTKSYNPGVNAVLLRYHLAF